MNCEEALKIAETLFVKGKGKHLNDLQRALLRASWAPKRLSYRDIAHACGYSESYLKYDVGPDLWKAFSEILQEKVNKTNIRSALERQWERLAQAGGEPAGAPAVSWGEAIDVAHFYGRQPELQLFREWILEERCRLVALLGMGGIGKTALSVKLAQQLAPHFERVVWRSLRNAPPLDDLLEDLLQTLTTEEELAEGAHRGLAALLQRLRRQRCLLVLDNADALLAEPAQRQEGQVYRSGYADYGELFHLLGEAPHQSCLLLTSREKLPPLAGLEGAHLPVRSHPLAGISLAAAQDLLHTKGCFDGSTADWDALIRRYGGNPLALKIVATSIQDLFGGSIGAFLSQGTLIFGDISHLLDQQISHLSAVERSVLRWLALWQEPATLPQLQRVRLEPGRILEALENLGRRSLIEPSQTGFTLQPVVVEYLLAEIVEQASREILEQRWQLLDSHALMLACTSEPVRQIQIRQVLRPILAQLRQWLGSTEAVVANLEQQLRQLQAAPTPLTGYGAGNVINLLGASGYGPGADWSRLTIRQAHWQGMDLRQVSLADSQLIDCTFTKPLGNVLSVAYSPDGQRLATGGGDGEIMLWSLDGTPLLSCDGHSGRVWSVAFSPDGQRLASGGDDHTVRLWDVATGRCLQTLRGHTNWVFSVAFSPDGQLLASGGDCTVRLWQLKTGQGQVLMGHRASVRSVAFSPGGQILASGSDDCTIQLWDWRTGQSYRTLTGHQQRVRSVAFSPTGEWLASGSSDRTVKLWDIRSGSCRHTLQGHQNWVFSVAFSPTGEWLASGSSDQTVRLWKVATLQAEQILRGHGNRVCAVAFSPDGTALASGSDDLAVRLWEIPSGICWRTMQGHASRVHDVAVSADGRLLASAHSDHAVRLWDVAAGSCLAVLRGHTNWVWTVAFSPDGGWLVSGGDDQMQRPWWAIRLWDLATGRCLKILEGHRSWVQSLAFSPDSQRFASGSSDHTGRIWERATGRCLHRLQGHGGRLWSVKFSPDGALLASSSDDQTIRLWNVSTGRCQRVLRGHQGWVQSVAFSPDGQWLASGSSDGTVRLWQVASGQCLAVLYGHQGWVRSVAFSPDGALLASGSSDQTIRLWDLETRTLREVWQGHRNWVRAIAFSPDGQTLVSGSQDETIGVWQVATGQRRVFRAERPYEGLDITGATGISPLQASTLKLLGAIEA